MCAARDTAGKLCGIVVLAVSPATVEAFLTELVAGFADGDIKKHKFEVQDGYLAATGYVLAQSMTGDVPLQAGINECVTCCLTPSARWVDCSSSTLLLDTSLYQRACFCHSHPDLFAHSQHSQHLADCIVINLRMKAFPNSMRQLAWAGQCMPARNISHLLLFMY